MNTETLEYKGYKITIAQDESPENPFESWDCEPPLLTYYGGRHGYFKAYGKGPDCLRDFVYMLPAACFERGNRVALIREYLDCTLREFAEEMRRTGQSVQDVLAEWLEEKHGSTPSGWCDAIEWFDTAESLLCKAGIACHNGQSNGYSQGDSTLVLAVATPEWIKTVGVKPEHFSEVCKGAFELYGQWAWGDVYGISEITSPEGLELDDASVWGFYGSDHEKSGLLESAQETIDCFLEKQGAEFANLENALCSAE